MSLIASLVSERSTMSKFRTDSTSKDDPEMNSLKSIHGSSKSSRCFEVSEFCKYRIVFELKSKYFHVSRSNMYLASNFNRSLEIIKYSRDLQVKYKYLPINTCGGPQPIGRVGAFLGPVLRGGVLFSARRAENFCKKHRVFWKILIFLR